MLGIRGGVLYGALNKGLGQGVVCKWFFGLRRWFAGLLVCWFAGLLVCWFAGLPGCLWRWPSLYSCWLIRVAPVRGGTYFSLPAAKKSRQKKAAQTANS
jgi:hypothetical protein